MTPAEQKVMGMVASGKITPGEGEELLGTLRPQRPSRPWRRLNPFERLATVPALGVALAIAAASIALGRLGVNFDGALDVHVGRVPSLPQSALQATVAWPLFALVAWIVAKGLRSHGRLVDFVAAIGVSRAPLAMSGLLVALMVGASRPHGARLAGVAAIGLLAIGCFGTLLFYGLKTASGLSGARLAVAVVGAAVVAEALSKAALIALR
jgi:hypothetical protein